MAKEKYVIPEFNLQALLDHIEKLVAAAPNNIILLVIDLFCGAGGTAEGFEKAEYLGKKIAAIICGINHDKKALYSGYMNHPKAYYSKEDIRSANLDMVKKIVRICRERWPQCPIGYWGSIDCTHHSGAKGGTSRDADSRTLAWHLDRYMELQPDFFWIENVKEFMDWGPLMEKVILERRVRNKKNHLVRKRITINEIIDPAKEDAFYAKAIKDGYKCYCPLSKIKQGKKTIGLTSTDIPIKSLKGTMYRPWVEKMERIGNMWHQARLLNCAEYGCPTNRKRLFISFVKKGWPIEWAMPTHAKDTVRFPGLLPLVPVKTCLDFSVTGESIFTPGKITSPKTFRRIMAGCIRFIAGGQEAFIAQRNSGDYRVISIDAPARTVTTTGGNQELVKAYFLTKYMGNNEKTGINSGCSVNDPAITITTQGRLALVEADFLIKYYGAMQKPIGMNELACTVTTKDRMALINPKFLVQYNGQSTALDVNNPGPALLTNEKLALVEAKYFLYRQFSDGRVQDVNSPAGALTTIPKVNLVEAQPWVMNTNFENVGYSVNEPADTILASRHHHYLLNPQWADGQGCSSDDPCFTLIARMDKAPPYLVSTEEGHVLIPVFKDDMPEVIKLKEFMAMYGIADIKMRMLLIPELLQIQSFPKNYYLTGSKTDQKKFIGNAVPPKMAKALAEGQWRGLVDFITQKIAA